MDFLALAEARYSVRKFQDGPVSRKLIEKILRAGQAAPTACNRQPQRVLAVESGEGMERLRRCTGSHFGAPAALLVCFDRDQCWVRQCDGKHSGEIDASIAATHMMLEAASLGVGTVWVMDFIPEAVRREFELPDQLEPVALLMMGYPAPDAAPSPMHAKSRPPEELAAYC